MYTLLSKKFFKTEGEYAREIEKLLQTPRVYKSSPTTERILSTAMDHQWKNPIYSYWKNKWKIINGIKKHQKVKFYILLFLINGVSSHQV